VHRRIALSRRFALIEGAPCAIAAARCAGVRVFCNVPRRRGVEKCPPRSTGRRAILMVWDMLAHMLRASRQCHEVR